MDFLSELQEPLEADVKSFKAAIPFLKAVYLEHLLLHYGT